MLWVSFVQLMDRAHINRAFLYTFLCVSLCIFAVYFTQVNHHSMVVGLGSYSSVHLCNHFRSKN